jgi:chemotaxis protein CheD
MSKYIPVGMGELEISRPPGCLVVYGIGSCVIVSLYDKKQKIGGFSHIMLPDSTGIPKEKINPGKFADTAIPLLYQKMADEGAFTSKLEAKVIGGAEMFPPTEDFSSNVGKDNIEAVACVLKKLHIPVVSEDIGGSKGRSIEMDLDSGVIKLCILGEDPKEL